MSVRFFKVDKITHTNENLTIDLLELQEMESDGMIGTPWGVTMTSPRFRLHFVDVVAFHVEPEIQNSISDSMKKIQPYLYIETKSKYVPEMGWAASMYSGLDDRTVQTHYVVYSENLVLHILSPKKPELASVN